MGWLWFPKRHFGFIKAPEDADADMFFHGEYVVQVLGVDVPDRTQVWTGSRRGTVREIKEMRYGIERFAKVKYDRFKNSKDGQFQAINVRIIGYHQERRRNSRKPLRGKSGHDVSRDGNAPWKKREENQSWRSG